MMTVLAIGINLSILLPSILCGIGFTLLLLCRSERKSTERLRGFDFENVTRRAKILMLSNESVSGRGIIGKNIVYRGVKCTVLEESIMYKGKRHAPHVKLVLYNGNSFLGAVLSKKEYDKLYSLYIDDKSQKPMRSRELRRDVKDFCTHMCILDCTTCPIKKYGKGSKTE